MKINVKLETGSTIVNFHFFVSNQIYETTFFHYLVENFTLGHYKIRVSNKAKLFIGTSYPKIATNFTSFYLAEIFALLL